jgi:hypothetical protein
MTDPKKMGDYRHPLIQMMRDEAGVPGQVPTCGTGR